MTTINLKDYYPWYLTNEYIEVTDEVAEALIYAKHTPWCQTVKISEFIIVLPIIFLDRISSI